MDETIYDTFINEVRGELAAIGHAQGEMLQVLQDEHMRDQIRSEIDSEMTSAESQHPSQEYLVPYSTPAHLVQHGREHRH